MTLGHATGPWVFVGLVGDYRLSGNHYLAQQSLEVIELHSLGRVFLIELSHIFVPGDIHDGLGLEIGFRVLIQNLPDESVLTSGELKQPRQEIVKKFIRR